jgi:hypothetical protein
VTVKDEETQGASPWGHLKHSDSPASTTHSSLCRHLPRKRHSSPDDSVAALQCYIPDSSRLNRSRPADRSSFQQDPSCPSSFALNTFSRPGRQPTSTSPFTSTSMRSLTRALVLGSKKKHWNPSSLSDSIRRKDPAIGGRQDAAPKRAISPLAHLSGRLWTKGCACFIFWERSDGSAVQVIPSGTLMPA